MKGLFHLAIVVQCLALLVWVGGIIFFAFVGAPLIFHDDVLERTGGTEVPGMIVSRIMERFSLWETVCAALLILALVEQIRQARAHPLRRWARLAVALVMTAVMVWYGHLIGPRMRDLREEIGDFDGAAVHTVAYAEFHQLHDRYERLMGVNLFLGLGLFIATVVMIPSAHRDRDRSLFRGIPA